MKIWKKNKFKFLYFPSNIMIQEKKTNFFHKIHDVIKYTLLWSWKFNSFSSGRQVRYRSLYVLKTCFIYFIFCSTIFRENINMIIISTYTCAYRYFLPKHFWLPSLNLNLSATFILKKKRFLIKFINTLI